jgi:hypothetical protein
MWSKVARIAGEALCNLSTDKRCSQALLNLGTFVDLNCGKLAETSSVRGKSYHGILGWVAILGWVKASGDDAKSYNESDAVAIEANVDICFLRVA